MLAEAKEALNALPGQTVFPDMGDQATAETDRNFMLRLRSREQKLIKKIDDALDRIDNGTFGICDDCGMEINIKRLDAQACNDALYGMQDPAEKKKRGYGSRKLPASLRYYIFTFNPDLSLRASPKTLKHSAVTAIANPRNKNHPRL